MTLEIDIRERTKADPSALWRLLEDSSSWPSWTPIESFKLEREGSADGIGEIRNFKTGRVQVREEIVERRVERRLSYVLLGGLAVRGYRADIDLTPRSDGTEIRWHTTFEAKVPGTGWLYRRALAKATREFVDGLVSYATRNDPAPSA
ncbi:MAG: SRPBCC family protein [Solirubrobacteraceae bacterium]